MAEIKDPKYGAMRSKRAELSEAITGLYDDIDWEIAKKVQAAFLRYEGAVLEVMQDDLDAIDQLIARVERAEALSNAEEELNTINSFVNHVPDTEGEKDG